MRRAVTALTSIPVRLHPNEASEMTSLLLFGEAVEVLGESTHFWEVKCAHDGFRGWIDRRQTVVLEDGVADGPAGWVVSETVATARPAGAVGSGAPPQMLVRGCRLARFEGGAFALGDRRFTLEGGAAKVGSDDAVTIGLRYLGSPYLWGGRSPFGIDCSGLVQISFGMAGIPLPRNSLDQARCGEPVASLDDLRSGDLIAADGTTVGSHIAIALDRETVLHASAHVRTDRLTEDGIISAQTGRLTHHLSGVRRVAPA